MTIINKIKVKEIKKRKKTRLKSLKIFTFKPRILLQSSLSLSKNGVELMYLAVEDFKMTARVLENGCVLCLCPPTPLYSV